MAFVDVAACPRCGEAHRIPMQPLTFAATVTVRIDGYDPLVIAKWTHWGVCPTFTEPIFHGLQPERGFEDVTIEYRREKA